uniref:DOMON domain-containing protein n=1 Tax=Leersia perrieri TaxID=77586 RepID=A0A0D9V8W5_9ORYZ
MDRTTRRQCLALLLVFSSSLLVSSQTTSDSCSTALSLGNLIPFNTTGLSCFRAWTSQDFILRFGKDSSSKNVWSFVLSAPDSGGYIAVGFAPTAGKMVGSSAVAGWVAPSSGVGTAKQYYLGGMTSSSCPPDKGNLALSSSAAAAGAAASPTIVSKGSRLYLAFQLTGQPITDLIYAVGPSGKLPASNGLLVQHLSMTAGKITLSGGGTTATGGGGGEGDEGSEGNEGGEGKGKSDQSGGVGGESGSGGDGNGGKSTTTATTAASVGSSVAQWPKCSVVVQMLVYFALLSVTGFF